MPTSRATVVRTTAFASPEEADSWLDRLRSEPDRADGEVAAAASLLNRALRAQRLAAADPHVRDVSAADALVTRIGFGEGEAVAEGRFARAWELPARGARRAKRSMEAPEERFAAIFGGRERTLPCEELTLRARVDLDARLPRQAALQARVALESLLADLGPDLPDDVRGAMEADRGPVGAAANAALRGELSEAGLEDLDSAIARMERALKRRRLGR